MDNNFAPSAAAAIPMLGEGISLVAAGTTIAAGFIVVGSITLGGVMYHLVQESASNPLVRQVLIDDGESDYDKILELEQKRLNSTTSMTAHPQEPDALITPIPEKLGADIIWTPIPEGMPNIISTPPTQMPDDQEYFPDWTTLPNPLITPIPDNMPGMYVLLNENNNDIFYVLYLKNHPKGGEPYWGITRGKGDMDNPVDVYKAVWARDRYHHKNAEGFGAAVPDKVSRNSAAIRGQEQIKIDESGGAQSKQGTSSNKNNGISDKNPKRDHYLEQANKEFGGKK